MSRRLANCMLAAAVLMGAAGMARAEDAKTEVKVTGTLQCAKCSLKEADATKCQDVLVVSADGKDVKYYLTDVDKANHQCHGTKAGVTVTGTTSEKDGKTWLAVTKLEMPAGDAKTEHSEHHHE